MAIPSGLTQVYDLVRTDQLSILGILIFLAFSLLSHLMLRKWHESAIKREH